MAKTRLQNLSELASRLKAKRFVRNYYKENGEMPSAQQVQNAQLLTPEETAKLSLENDVRIAVQLSNGTESAASFDYIVDKESWDASYENGVLKAYYEYYDVAGAPYKEDLWNTVENRPANWTDWHKENDEYVFDENGSYIYDNCVRCWEGAVNAPGAKYPWCAVSIEPFKGTIKFNYDGGEDVYPWGKDFRTFGRTFAIASIPAELGDEYQLVNGVTTFDPSKLVVTLIK